MYQDEWWTQGQGETRCTPKEIQTALMGSIVVDILPLASNEEITVSKRVSCHVKGLICIWICFGFSRYNGMAAFLLDIIASTHKIG